MVLTAPLIDGVDDEDDEPRLGVARVRAISGWCSSQPQPNSRPKPSQLPQDNLHVTTSIVGLEGLSTSGT